MNVRKSNLYASMLRCILIAAFAGIYTLSAQTIQVDFGGDTAASGWNLVSTDANDGSPVDLAAPDGSATGVAIMVTTPFNGVNGSGTASGPEGFPAEATGDSIFGNDVDFMGVTAPNPAIEISGLDPTLSYAFTIFASRMGVSDRRSALFTATGSNIVLGALNASNNESETVRMGGIIPSSDGTVVLDFIKAASNDNGNGFIYLGALIIQDSPITLDDYPTAFSPDPTRHQGEIDAFLANDAVKMPPEGAIVATGSSSMRGWHNRIHSDLDGLSIIARGFGGSFYSDLIYYADSVILPYNPRAVLVYEGDNDIKDGKSPQTVLSDLQFLVNYCRATLPELRFYVISIKPSIARWNVWPQMTEANQLMEAYCNETEGMLYIDAGTVLLQQDGTPRTDIFGGDNLHFNSAGYDAWTSVIAPIMLENEQEFEETMEPVEFDETALYIDFGSATSEAGWNSITMDALDGAPIALIDGTGAETGVTLTSIDRFNGINGSGSSAGLDAFIPDATADSLFGNDQDWSGVIAPNPSFQFDGLNPESSYSFTIFASRMGASDVRSATYTAVGANEVSGDLDAAGNEVSTITLAGILPDADGSIAFDFKKAASNTNSYGFCYLGGVIVEEESKAAVQIDFGGDSTAEGWNLVNNSLQDSGSLDLLNAAGSDSGLSFTTVTNWNNINSSGYADGTALLPPTVTADSIFGNDQDWGGVIAPNPAFSISGMDTGAVYKFTIYASRMGASDNRSTLYTVSGGNTVSGVLDAANNGQNVLIIDGIVADTDGKVVLDFQRADANTSGYGFIYLGALVIEKSTSDPVEPGPLPWDGSQAGDSIISPWFGGFDVAGDGWIDHDEMIWIYVGEVVNTSSMWIYSLYLEAWVWSDMNTFPLVYNSATGKWTYYFYVPDVGIWEYDVSVDEWVFHP